MTLFPATAGARLSVEFNGATLRDEHVNVFHFAKRDGSVFLETQLGLLLSDFEENIMADMRNMFYTDMTGATFKVETLTPEPRVGITGGGSYNGIKVIAGDKLPHWVSLRISWDCGYLSRRWNGKTYIGGLREQDQSGGFATQEHMDRLIAFAGAMITRYGQNSVATPYTFCILSDPDHVLPEGIVGAGQRAAQLAAVQSNTITNVLTSLRRRMK